MYNELFSHTRYKQLSYLKEALSHWEKSGSRTPLLELLSSELKNVSGIKGGSNFIFVSRSLEIRVDSLLCICPALIVSFLF